MLSKRVQLLKPSPILMLAAKAAELKASGKDVVSLTVGEPDWETYEPVKEAAFKAIREGKIKYTPPPGIPELRKAVAKVSTQDLGLPYEMADVTISSGAKFILFSALQALCDPGDEVIIPAPFWASYTSMVDMAEARPKIVVCDDTSDFKMTAAMFRAAINPKTKVLLLNSPSNPTGKVYTRTELTALAEVLREFPRIMVISDDIYNKLVFDGQALAPHILHVAPDLKNRVIAMNGASKTYAMTGWRLGWAVGPREVINAMTNYASQSVSCANAIAQYAGVAAIDHCADDVKKTVQVLIQRRDFLLDELKSVPGIQVAKPDGAFYIWMKVSHYLNKKYQGRELHNTGDMAAALLEAQLVAVVPGVEFGLEGYFRLSFALQNDKAKEAVRRMKLFFESLV